MKALWRHKLLCALLTAALLLQCGAVAFAASPYPEIYHLEGGVPDENGVWTPEYWVDSRGNRLVESVNRVYAADDLPSSYDLRDYGMVTPVKYQAGSNNCWAFSAIASLESSYIKQGYGTAENTDFSEAHLVWFSLRRTQDPASPIYGDGLYVEKPFKTAGNWTRAASVLLAGSGLQLEANAPWIMTYDDETMMQMAQDESDRYVSYARMWGVTNIRDGSAAALKRKIMQNGAASLSYYDDYMHEKTGYSADMHSYYQTAHVQETNHVVAVVGWDDAYPRTNFNENQRPTADGAWLVKGSWSYKWGDNGYYWLSYEDPSICDFASFVAAPEDVFDHIYQYDGAYPYIFFSVSNSAKMANVFTAQREEELTHIAFFSPNDSAIKVTAEVYTAPDGFVYSGTNPTSGMQKATAATTTVSGIEYGYSTIELNNPVRLSTGQKYSVVVTMELNGSKVNIPAEGQAKLEADGNTVTYGGNVGESFFGYNGIWYDTNAYPGSSGTADYNNVPLKAMTRDVAAEPTLTLLSAPDKTTYLVGDTLDTAGLTLLYTDENGDAYEVTEGYVCDPVTLETAGTQTVTVTYQGLTATFDVTVGQVGTFLVTDAAARPGETVDVAVRISRNPGIVSAWLELSYDPAVLSLEDVRNGNIFSDSDCTPGNDLTQIPFRTLFLDALSTENYTQDGDLVVFTFRVRTDAPAGATAVTLTFNDESTCSVDLENAPFRVQNGTLTVQRLPGDVNADGVINLKDAVMLRRYLANWGVTISLENADVDRMDSATLRDVALISRFLAGGYGVTLL